MKALRVSSLVLLLSLLFLAKGSWAQLQWFGYVSGADYDLWLDGTASYVNFGWFATDANAASTATSDRLNAMAQRNLKGIVDLGQLLWNPADGYRTLYPDYVSRWNTWKSANAGALTSAKLLGFSVRDEPFHTGTHIPSFELASQMVRHDYPWAKLILIEAADTVSDDAECADPGCYFNSYRYATSTFDWVCVEKYAINPATDSVFLGALNKIKQTYPGRKIAYSADGWWGAAHIANLSTSITVMRAVATEWYNVASADPDAVLLGFFIFGPFPEGTSSLDFPPSVLEEQTRIGRLVTGRVRAQLFAPVGIFERIGTDNCARGWACDPDGAWGERVRVDLYLDGAPAYVTYADQPSELFPQCRSGIAHRFQTCLAIGTKGKKVTAYAHDLDSGVYQLPANCFDSPACVWYPSNYLPTGLFEGISASGVAQGWACDKDSPASSIRVVAKTAPPTAQVIGTWVANLSSEAAVNSQCGGGTAHRFSFQLPLSTKGQLIAVYGQDVMEGSAFLPASGSNCPSVGYCTW
jgi:hypothetical protein